MPRFAFTGGDPIDHFHLGRVEPGDVVDLAKAPDGAWRAVKRAKNKTTAEPDSDEPETNEES